MGVDHIVLSFTSILEAPLPISPFCLPVACRFGGVHCKLWNSLMGYCPNTHTVSHCYIEIPWTSSATISYIPLHGTFSPLPDGQWQYRSTISVQRKVVFLHRNIIITKWYEGTQTRRPYTCFKLALVYCSTQPTHDLICLSPHADEDTKHLLWQCSIQWTVCSKYMVVSPAHWWAVPSFIRLPPPLPIYTWLQTSRRIIFVDINSTLLSPTTYLQSPQHYFTAACSLSMNGFR